MKTLSLSDLKNGGYLQEVNRRFFHPLGLALAIRTEEGQSLDEGVLQVNDARDDEEGYYFSGASDPMEASERMAHAGKIDFEIEAKRATRVDLFGDAVQGIEHLARIEGQ